jgi:hypothetical protein
MSILKVKWRARFKIVVVDEEDFDKVKDIKWTYFNYGDFVGYNVKTATKKRINTIHELIIGPINNQTHEIIHINKNGLDNRKENLSVVTKFLAQQHKNSFTSEGQKLLESYNKIVANSTDLTQATIKENILDIPQVISPVILKKPKLKTIEIEGIDIPEQIKPYLYYSAVKKDKTDYFYLIDYPLILEKCNRRRFQGTKSKSLNTKEKFDHLINQLQLLDCLFEQKVNL